MRYGVLRFTINGTVHDAPIDDTSVVVGRAEGHGIRLDHSSVSRRHARIAVEGGRLTVEDLGSAAGVFIDGVRIPPHAPTLLPPGKHLRIGSVEAELVPASQPAPGGEPGGQAAAPSGAAAGRERIEVFVTPPAIEVEPGGAVEVTVRIANRAAVVDEIGVTVAGVPSEWTELSEGLVRLRPGEEGQAVLRLAPPRSPTSRAQDYTLTIAISSQSGRSPAEQASATLRVRPYRETQLELRPVRSTGNFTVRADNRGNRRSSFSLDGVDEEGYLVFDFDPPVLEADPASEARARLRVRHPRRGLFGRPTVAPFSVIVRDEDEGGKEERLDGQLQVTPPLERFKRLFVILFVAAVAAALAALVYFVIGKDWNWSRWPPWEDEAPAVVSPSPTAAGPTESADAAVAATLTAIATAGAEATTGNGNGAGSTPSPEVSPSTGPAATEQPAQTPIPQPTATPTQVPQVPPAQVPRDGLVAEYLFGGNLKDSSGSGDTGSASGGPAFVSDRFGTPGRALHLDGNDSVLFNRDQFTPTNEISVSLWIRLDDVNGGLSYFAVSSDFGLFTSGGEAGIAISLPGTESASGKVEPEEWYHILGTYDGEVIRVYVDGVLADKTVHPGTIADLDRPLTLGVFGRTFWKGTMDDLRIYDRVISDADEIEALFQESGFLKFRSPVLRPLRPVATVEAR